MKVLVTRAQADADETATLLRERGHAPFVAPLSTVHPREGGEVALDGVQAVLVTSANGIRAFAPRSPSRDIPIFAVGDRSATVALALGFQSVVSANGDAAALGVLVSERLSPKEGALLHAAGANADETLSRALSDFTVRREILYDVDYAQSLPQELAAALAQNQLDAALFYSPGGARHFRELIAKSQLAETCSRLVAACISANAAAALSPLRFAQVRVAASPDQPGLLNLLY
ncbi:MAG TPA: uroporphyrinogen-III synthase [Rhizomicrobium sp.]|nr:uroporphyrinogen-III synthase [Rhizomicrobium sp.]